MSEKFTAVESPSGRTTARRGYLRSLRRRLAAGATTLSVSRVGGLVLALSALYFALVVPADFALLLTATLFVVVVAAMVPLAAVAAVTRLVE